MACFLFYQRNRVANVRHAHGPAETRPMGEHYLRCCFSMSHWLMCDSVIDVSAYFEWLQIFCSFISGFVCLLHPYELVRRVFRVFYGPIYTPASSACLSLFEATRWVRVEIVPSARSLVCHKFDELHGNGSRSNTQDRSPPSQCSVTFSC